MSYKTFEHKADTGIIGMGESLEKAFEEGAKAMFNVMVDIGEIESKHKVEVSCKSSDLPALFVEWLNELLYQKDKHGLFFSEFKVKKIEKRDKIYMLEALAFGEPLDLKKHKTKVEVKGATYSQLRVYKKNGDCVVKCVVDV